MMTTSPTLDLDALIDALIDQGLSTKTIACYASTLRRASLLAGERGWQLGELTGRQARELSACWPWSRSSQMQLRSALVRLWDAQGRQDPPIRAIRVPKRARGVSRALGTPQAALLARAAEARPDRKGLAVTLGLYAGLRRAEIASLEWSQLSADGWLRVMGKGDVERHVPVHPVALVKLRAAEISRRRGSRWIFPGRWDGPVNPTTIWLWTRQVSAEAGLGEVSTHVLRHTALATAHDATGDLRAVQELAGHARPETTAIYTRTTRAALERAVTAICYQSEEA